MRVKSVKKLVFSALFSTLVLIGTQFMQFPLVIGYFNIGDCFVLLFGWIVGGAWAMLGAAIGAGLADFLSGYTIYIPATVVVKALMALIAYVGYKVVANKQKPILITGYVVSGVVAELLMIFWYYLFEGCIYDFNTAGVAMIGNVVQGAISFAVAFILVSILEGMGVLKRIRRQTAVIEQRR